MGIVSSKALSVKDLRLNPPVACGDSPPNSGALGSTHKVANYAKAAPIRGGGIPQGCRWGYSRSSTSFS